MGKIEQPTAENSQNPPAVPGQYHGYYSSEDEISFIDIWRVLAKRKLVVIGVTVLVTISSIAYALLLPSIYRSDTVLAPPVESDVQALIIKGIDVVRVNKDSDHLSTISAFYVESVYTMYKRRLSARAVRYRVFKEMGLKYKLMPNSFDVFNGSLSVSIVKYSVSGGKIPTVTLSMEGKDPVFITEVIKRIAVEARQATISEIVSNLKSKITSKVNSIKKEIDLLRVKAKRQRLDEINRLETADALRKANILDEILILRKISKQKRLDKIVLLKEKVAIARSQGSKVRAKYEAQIGVLSKRVSNDSFVPGLRNLQKQLLTLKYNRKVEQLKARISDDSFIRSLRDKESELKYMEAIHVDPKTVSVARVEKEAQAPKQRIKPKRKLIVILGFILGLMLGIFIAFFSNFIAKAKMTEQVSEK